MEKYKVFLSHFTPEGSVARRLKEFLEGIFAGAVEVFVSSHEWSLRLGDPWEVKVRQELADSSMILVLLSSDSIVRPWVNFEAGTAWLRDIALIPMVHRGLSLERLDRPFSSLEGVSLLDPRHVRKLVSRIGQDSGLSPIVTDELCSTVALDISSLDRDIDEEAARKCTPRQARSALRFYLYSKSQTQYRQNLKEVAGSPLSCFRKPHLQDVFAALVKFGQPDTTVVSIDEYWISLLAEARRLEDLTQFVKDHKFLHELMASATYAGRQWSAPHFLDLGYCSSRADRSELVLPWLEGLAGAPEMSAHVDRLRQAMGTDRLLAYDFHSPDTCACVILEFIEAFGDGWRSLRSPATAGSDRNLRALDILRAMVGNRPSTDFLLGEPADLDKECDTVPFLREWHSRMTDEPRCRATHRPIFDSPIPGTLGGWHVGVLSGSPSVTDATHALATLLTRGNQQERLRLGAGLPTLAEFYTVGDLARQTDQITGWTLANIAASVKRAVRRSVIPEYPALRDKLCDLHYQLVAGPQEAVAQILTRWAELFGRGNAGKKVN